MGCESLATKAELEAVKNTISNLTGKVKELENQLADKATKNELKKLSDYLIGKIKDIQESVNLIKDELPKKFNSSDFKLTFAALFGGTFFSYFNPYKMSLEDGISKNKIGINKALVEAGKAEAKAIGALEEALGAKIKVIEVADEAAEASKIAKVAKATADVADDTAKVASKTAGTAATVAAKALSLASFVLELFNALNINLLWQAINTETEQRQAADVALGNDISKALGYSFKAINDAKSAQNTADQAIDQSKKSLSKAEDALDKANNALATAKESYQKALESSNKADSAISISNKADAKSDQAITKADQADGKANLAINEAAKAKAIAENAIAQTEVLKNELDATIYELSKTKAIAENALNDAQKALDENKLQNAEIATNKAELAKAKDEVELLKNKIKGLINKIDFLIIDLVTLKIDLETLKAKYSKLEAFFNNYYSLAANTHTFVKETVYPTATDAKNTASEALKKSGNLGYLIDPNTAKKSDIDNLANQQKEAIKNLENQQTKQLKDLETKQDNKLDEALKDNVNDKNLGDKLKELLPAILTGSILTGLALKLTPMITAPINNTLQGMNNTINQINQNTAPSAQITNTQTGICNSLNNGCLGNQVAAPLQNIGNTANTNNGLLLKLIAMLTALQTLLQGFIATMWIPFQAAFNTFLTAFNTFQTAFNQLYKNLGIDRALNVINMMLLLHNASMLSYNLFQTLGDTVDISLKAIGFNWKDSKGNELEFSQVVGTSIKGFIIGIVGEQTYKDTVKSWDSLNRIYQASANLLYSIRGLFDEMLDLSVMLGEKLARFMNVAREDGLVREDGYNHQSEIITPQNRFTKMVQKFTDGLGEADESLESIAMISSSVYGITTELNDLKDTKNDFDQVINEETKKLKETYDKDKENSQIKYESEPSKSDLNAVN